MHLGHFSNEDFDRGPASPYLQPRVSTNVLNSLCADLQAKQEITRHIVIALAAKECRVRTDFHAKWAMECLGYSFSLPLEQYDVIQKAINVYSVWLNQPEARPECITAEEGFYQREIISHFSLLFLERPSYPPHGQHRHAELCKSALAALRTLGQQGDLSKDTWNAMLKVLLLVSKQLLTSAQPRVPDLTNQLCPLLLRTLLEMWVRSNTREIELWAELSDSMGKWTHHQWLIEHWSSVVLGLTRRIAYMLYVFGSTKIVFEFTFISGRADLTSSPSSVARGESMRTDSVELDLSLEQVVYFGYQLLSMMLNCTKDQLPADPDLDCELVRKVAQITDYFLSICDERNDSKALEPPTFPKIPNLHPSLSSLSKEFEKQHFQYFTRSARLPIPSATGLLDLLGSWLFAHASRSHMYEKGRAQAAGALCRIMCKAAGPVHEDYLARFYSVVLRCMNGSGLAAREIVKNSQTLFTMSHVGIRQLLTETGIPKAVELYLSDSNSDLFLRKSCYSVLCSYVALPYYYLSQSSQSDSNPYFRSHYESLAQSVCEVLTATLKNERDSDSIRTMTWLITVFLATTPAVGALPVAQRDIYGRFVLGVMDLLEQTTEWQLSIDLIEVLVCMAYFLRTKEWEDYKAVVKPLVQKLCDFVVGKIAKAGYDVMLSALFSCLLGWLVSFPAIFQDEDVRKRCLDVASKGIKSEKDFAIFFQSYLLTRLQLHLPAISFSSHQSLIFSLSSAKLQPQPVSLPGKHYILGEDTLVSLYDSSASNPDCDEVLVVIRDTIGRYAWKTQAQYTLQTHNHRCENTLFKLRDSRRDSIVIEEAEPQTEAVLIGQLDDSEQESFAQFSDLIRRQRDLNCDYMESFQPYQPSSQSFHQSPSLVKSHRELLNCLGLLSLQSAESLLPVDGPELLSTLRTLDSKPERDSYHLVAIYLPSPEMTEFTVSNSQYSQGFQDLLRDLGVKVSTENGLPAAYEHLGELAENMGSFLYFSDFAFEFITISPAVMPADRLKGWSYQRLTQNCDVVLLWNERGADPYSEKQPQLMENSILKKKKNLIIVTPLGNGLMKVKLVLIRYPPGPLQSDMIVPGLYLAQMVIRTTISLHGSQNSSRLTCSKRRKEAITKLAHSAAKQTRVERAIATFSHAFRT